MACPQEKALTFADPGEPGRRSLHHVTSFAGFAIFVLVPPLQTEITQ
jgi:hypothetical protein